jgi:hypothetical protein
LDSTNSEIELLSDRVNFKLFAAEQHLNRLKEIENNYGGIMGNRRIYAEIEIDSFFAQIIGAKDSLLVQINQKLGLGLPIEEAKISNLNPKLKAINKGFLLTELNTLCSQTDSWLWLLNELRNHSLHRAMINKRASVQVQENINSNTSVSAKPEVYLLINPRDINKVPMNKSAVTYLQESLQQMRDLIEAIRNKEPLLK